MKRLILLTTLAFVSIVCNVSAQEQWAFSGLKDKYILALTAGSDNKLYAGMERGGVAQFDGTSWTQLDNGLPENSSVIGIHQTPAGQLYAITIDSVYRYEGSSWIALPDSLPAGMSLTSLAGDTLGNVFVGMSGRAVYKLNGNIWSDMSKGLPDTAIITVLHAHRANGILLAGTDASGIWAYVDTAWVDITKGFIPSRVLSIATSFNGSIGAGTIQYGVFGYDDAKWDTVNLGLIPEFGFYPTCQAIFITPTRDTAYLGTPGGPYRFENDVWVKLREGLSGFAFDVGYIAEYDGHIFIGTYVGVYRLQIGSGVDVESGDNGTMSVIPNPTNGSAVIRYSVEQSNNVSWQLCDAHGSIVATDVVRKRTPGKYTDALPVERLAVGAYFVRINIGDRTYIRTLAVVR